MDQIILPRLSIEITTRCNLKCKYCAVGIPTQKEVIHLDVATVRLYLQKVFEVVDYVESLEFTGGEPLLHESLPEMIHTYMDFKPHFGRFLIVTNGTVKPTDSLLTVLEQYKASGIIHISDYGLAPARTKDLIYNLEQIGFPYRVDKYWGDDQYQGGWVDPGAVAPHGRTQEQLTNIFANCGLSANGGCWRTHKGQLHFCARSCRCADEGFVFPGDFIDLLDPASSIEEKRAQLRALRQKQYLKACDYCNGTMGTKDSSKRVPAGEQL
ncbi:MAG: radical SAM protein [Clostridiales bacterium]|nr:radical SAM protein [Clostridiales bacterium]